MYCSMRKLLVRQSSFRFEITLNPGDCNYMHGAGRSPRWVDCAHWTGSLFVVPLSEICKHPGKGSAACDIYSFP